jgi:hypothetical protein
VVLKSIQRLDCEKTLAGDNDADGSYSLSPIRIKELPSLALLLMHLWSQSEPASKQKVSDGFGR